MAELDAPDQVAQPVVIQDRSMIVLYGSEMGNAEDIAIEIGQLTQRLRFQTTVDEMDNFKLVRFFLQPSHHGQRFHDIL